MSSSYSWNVFRYVGDYLHLGGVCVLLATLLKNQSVIGISKSTQILYCTTFCCRYMDLFDHNQTAYLVFFKLTYSITSVIVLGIFWKFEKSYEAHKDTCNLVIVFCPCITAAILLTDEYSLLSILWTLSQFLEGFAMVPQYIFCYRDKGARDVGVSFYVSALGGYRVFYALNWIYKKINMPHYSDVQSWMGGIIEIMFFVDFLNFRFTGHSMLRTAVLKVDEKVNEIQDAVEKKVLGSDRSTRAIGSGGSGELRRRGGGRADQELSIDV